MLPSLLPPPTPLYPNTEKMRHLAPMERSPALPTHGPWLYFRREMLVHGQIGFWEPSSKCGAGGPEQGRLKGAARASGMLGSRVALKL